jgi:hypothetical protein
LNGKNLPVIASLTRSQKKRAPEKTSGARFSLPNYFLLSGIGTAAPTLASVDFDAGSFFTFP